MRTLLVMWTWLGDRILRYRIALLGVIAGLTIVMGYVGLTRVEVSQEFARVVPTSDPDYQDYEAFKDRFGLDGDAVVVGLRSPDPFTPQRLNALRQAGDSLLTIPGVAGVLDISRLAALRKAEDGQGLTMEPLWDGPIQSPAQAEAYRQRVAGLPFYRQWLFQMGDGLTPVVVRFTPEALNANARHDVNNAIDLLYPRLEAQGVFTGAYISGLPFIRSYTFHKLPKEMQLFLALAVLLTAMALYVFYRSLYAVVFPMVLLLVSTVFTLGTIGLLGYKLSILMALLPPIIVILGIPPSIYMVSDYHEEFQRTGNKLRALRAMVQKLGLVTLMINANTAFGFLTLYFTQVVVLQEFGLVAFLGTLAAYVLTLVMIPGIFSLLPPPSDRHLRHLDAPRINRLVAAFDRATLQHRRWIYAGTLVLTVGGAVGLTQVEAVSYITDDLPSQDDIVADLRVLETELGGVMPFEIVVDGQKPNAFRSLTNLRKLEDLQRSLTHCPELTPSLSVVNVVQWANQAMFNGNSKHYRLPSTFELQGIWRLTRKQDEAAQLMRPLVDSTYRYARVTAYVADLGSQKLPPLLDRVRQEMVTHLGVDPSIHAERTPVTFPPSTPSPTQQLEAFVTGTTRLFIKANAYLIENLSYSLLAAFLLIGLQMFLLFGSWRIMVISMVPNLVPLVATAGIMGFAGVPLKPSTALIYELAFGIAIDNSIHYLALYRHHRKRGLGIQAAVGLSTRRTGMSILYTSAVLLAGFSIFGLSAFGSTRALGTLTSVTLFVAFFTNLLLMPALLRDFDRHWTIEGPAMIDDAEDGDEDPGNSPEPGPAPTMAPSVASVGIGH